ncbi:MAG TPA: PQ-loop domain-containing transporter [Candidatus Nanoarchaeia archaeon]|nr:PQ-loop domain-containing transporter [Candidatus Nanoarchaeia archaeon]
MPSFTTIIGTGATLLSSVKTIPQIIKSLRTKRLYDISQGWIVLGMASGYFWIVYGLLLGDFPLISSSLFTLGSFLVLFALKRKYG